MIVWEGSVGLGFENLEEFSKASVYKCVHMFSFSFQEKQKDEKQDSLHPRAQIISPEAKTVTWF